MTLTYEQRENYACKVCQNVPDEDGMIDHGRGCYTQSEDGGGSSWVDLTEAELTIRTAELAELAAENQRLKYLLSDVLFKFGQNSIVGPLVDQIAAAIQ